MKKVTYDEKEKSLYIPAGCHVDIIRSLPKCFYDRHKYREEKLFSCTTEVLKIVTPVEPFDLVEVIGKKMPGLYKTVTEISKADLKELSPEWEEVLSQVENLKVAFEKAGAKDGKVPKMH